jgi:hypothetical protein
MIFLVTHAIDYRTLKEILFINRIAIFSVSYVHSERIFTAEYHILKALPLVINVDLHIPLLSHLELEFASMGSEATFQS